MVLKTGERSKMSSESIKHGVKGVFSGTFWQLLVVYTIAVVLISFSLFWKYTFHFEIFAVIIALIGAFALYHYEVEEKENMKKWMHISLLVLGLVLIFVLRLIPYLHNSVPIGYDAGIYKYGLESFSGKGFGVDDWVKGSMSPGFLYLLVPLLKIGFSGEFLLIWVFIFFCLLLGFSIYLAARAYFGQRTAIIALLLYAVSSIQFKVFTYLYYKNVIALACLFFSIYFLDKYGRELAGLKAGWSWSRFWFIVFGVIVGVMHLPTFFIFGVAYVLFILNNRKSFMKKFVDGFLILVISLIGYIGFWNEAIAPLIMPVAKSFVEPGTAPGTFISFFVYQFSTLYLLPFAILGFVHLFWQKKFNMVFFLTFVTGVIVYFQFFFFNRFIIHLDVFLILVAASAFSLIIANGKKLGTAILVFMMISSLWVTWSDAIKTKPLVGSQDFALIKMIDANTEKSSRIIAISSEYSPWILAYSNRPTIAPGLFKENQWDQSKWEKFWNEVDEDETKDLMKVYSDKPVYLFVGTKSFNNPCFSEFLSKGSSKLLRYECG